MVRSGDSNIHLVNNQGMKVHYYKPACRDSLTNRSYELLFLSALTACSCPELTLKNQNRMNISWKLLYRRFLHVTSAKTKKSIKFLICIPTISRSAYTDQFSVTNSQISGYFIFKAWRRFFVFSSFFVGPDLLAPKLEAAASINLLASCRFFFFLNLYLTKLFLNLRTLKSGHRRTICASKTSFDGFFFVVDTFSVGYPLGNFLSPVPTPCMFYPDEHFPRVLSLKMHGSKIFLHSENIDGQIFRLTSVKCTVWWACLISACSQILIFVFLFLPTRDF